MHVGVVWGGRNKFTSASASDAAKYLRRNNITHACVCYSDVESMNNLAKLCPDVKFYRLQWITDLSQALDDDIQGIKLHSHRGQGFSFDCNNRGLDYTSKNLRQFLKNLPEGLIVQYHTQGSTSLQSISRPMAIAKLAIDNRHLKHIIVHAGSYGLQSYYPSRVDSAAILTALSQENLVQEAVLVANRLANVYLDSSALISPTHYKTELLFNKFRKAALGSDWPFSQKTPYGELNKAERLLDRLFGEDGSVVDLIHQRALHFLETPIKILFKEEGEIANIFAGRDPKVLSSAKRNFKQHKIMH